MTLRTKVNFKSGVLPIPIYTKPFPCGGHCIFCPREETSPNSYTDNEDTLFAKSVDFSSAMQFRRLLDRLPNTFKEKTYPFEIIILGGSFSALTHDYRIKYISDLYSQMSGINNIKIQKHKSGLNNHLCSILTVESRPDQIDIEECRFLRSLGVSKVEIGVQHTSNDILIFNERGHDQDTVIRATKILKDEGFKVGYHIMLGLPSSSYEDDYRMLSKTLWHPEYSPDYLKIYPCVLLKNKKLQPKLRAYYEMGNWIPLNNSQVIRLLEETIPFIPTYVRVSRVQRQFSDNIIECGVSSGVRNMIRNQIMDVRAREVGFSMKNALIDELAPMKHSISWNGRDGIIEIVGKEGALLGITRIRDKNKDDLVIRELRVFGKATALGERGQIQGNGIGKLLLKKVEDIAVSNNKYRILVNPAFGAKPYFINQGYTIASDNMLEKNLISKLSFSVNHSCKTEKDVKERMRESESELSGRRGMTKRDVCAVERAGFREWEKEQAERRVAEW